jgi:2,5-furandicarboxylate decarboxylase 1
MKKSSKDFRGFMMMLEKENELVHVKREVNTEYEIAAVTAKLDGKQAIFFENVRDSKIRITCNVLATPRRFCLALGGTSEKSNEHNVKKKIHTRVLKLSTPYRILKGHKTADFLKRIHVETCMIYP